MYSGSEAHNKVSLPEFRAKRAHQVFFSDFRWFLITKFPYEQPHERISRDVWKPQNFFDKTQNIMVHRQETRTQTRFVEVNFQVFLLQIDMNVSMFYFLCIFGVTAVFPREISARLTEKWTFLAPALCLTDVFLWHQKSEQAQTLEVNTLNNIVTMVQVKKKKIVVNSECGLNCTLESDW